MADRLQHRRPTFDPGVGEHGVIRRKSSLGKVRPRGGEALEVQILAARQGGEEQVLAVGPRLPIGERLPSSQGATGGKSLRRIPKAVS